MAYIDPETRRLHLKILYCGAAESGKTTNLKILHQRAVQSGEAEFVELSGSARHTLFFDYFPLRMGESEEGGLTVHIYSAPGQFFLDAVRKTLIDGTDAIVFVADSAGKRQLENFKSFQLLLDACEGRALPPLVVQYNKRDCVDPVRLGSLEAEFRLTSPHFSAIASKGIGVVETLEGSIAFALEKLG